MLSEFVEPKWQRRRGIRKIHVVAVLSAVVSAGAVVLMFNEFGVVQGPGGGERQLIATVDLRLGTPALAFERGQARARADLEAGLLKLQRVGPPPSKAETARDARMKQRYGVEWVSRSDQATPLTPAFADGYNGVMRAEIERRHGKAVAEGLLGFENTRKQP
ncbi:MULTISPECIES: hypothetical protein [unclassified Roseateles]|uniref:hypothetical protein n=1 Tax=unclassified Roseateles TaxID=2626991 RepID=UPI0006F26FBF|nr:MULTISPECIES: hypothetical protein [unclassified Roseateles]KQW52268.1 hypothetical protein ASC81_06715 [Pelomonas sp. Root405]KRA78502.1 hypothetical protein ASD88_06720 [Pelomonas sp. Root662]